MFTIHYFLSIVLTFSYLCQPLYGFTNEELKQLADYLKEQRKQEEQSPELINQEVNRKIKVKNHPDMRAFEQQRLEEQYALLEKKEEAPISKITTLIASTLTFVLGVWFGYHSKAV